MLSLIIFLIYYIASTASAQKRTQRDLPDRDLLRLIARQPDGLLSVKQLAQESGLTKAEARARFSQLYMAGLLNRSTSKKAKYYYSLRQPLDERKPPDLSPEPFLTADDILQLFKFYDYKLDTQKLIIATGLPLRIIKREMKYFESEGMVTTLSRSVQYGAPSSKVFVLQEPYRSDPRKFLSREREMNAKVKELLRQDLMIWLCTQQLPCL